MMSFNNPDNRCNLTGYIVGDLQSVDDSSLEFKLNVQRKTKPGGKVWYDTFNVIVYNKNTIAFCKNQLRSNMTIQVKGEIRNWYDGTVKICCEQITIKS